MPFFSGAARHRQEGWKGCDLLDVFPQDRLQRLHGRLKAHRSDVSKGSAWHAWHVLEGTQPTLLHQMSTHNLPQFCPNSAHILPTFCPCFATCASCATNLGLVADDEEESGFAGGEEAHHDLEDRLQKRLVGCMLSTNVVAPPVADTHAPSHPHLLLVLFPPSTYKLVLLLGCRGKGWSGALRQGLSECDCKERDP